MAKITNYTNISLPLAVWLVSDGYDFSPGTQKAISVTSLIKPVRQILLRERLTEEVQDTPDVSDYIASRLGHSIHDSIEQCWKDDKTRTRALRLLGYPDEVIDKMVINPKDPSEVEYPIYLEQRMYRNFRGYTITGKFDMIINGHLHDHKSTSAWSYILGSKDSDYAMQGSLYRWLSDGKVTDDAMDIEFVFTDWQRAMAKQNPNYPQSRVISHHIELKTLEETERYLNDKIDELEAYADKPEPELPFCSDLDLWRSEPVWKYYSNPAKTDGRATKNFDNPNDAAAFRASKGRGVVIEVPGKVKACSYCPCFNICSQKDLYEHG